MYTFSNITGMHFVASLIQQVSFGDYTGCWLHVRHSIWYSPTSGNVYARKQVGEIMLLPWEEPRVVMWVGRTQRCWCLPCHWMTVPKGVAVFMGNCRCDSHDSLTAALACDIKKPPAQ